MTKSKLQPVRMMECPQPLIFGLLREPNKRRRYDAPAEVPGLADIGQDDAMLIVQELLDLGLIAKDHGRFTIVDWTVERVVEHLALAGALLSLAAYQIALRGGDTDFTHLEHINQRLRALDHTDPSNLLDGAFLDFQFHLEMVRLSVNKAAWTTYCKAITPAVWIAGANYFQLGEALSSLAGHDRLIQYMQSGDALRARDAASFHLEDAIAAIRKAGTAKIESYPSDSR